MLSQRNIQLWEGYSIRGVPFRENHVVPKRAFCVAPLRQCTALYLQRRRKVRVTGGRKSQCATSVVVRSQGIQASPVEPVSKQAGNSKGFVRANDGGASQLRLDGDDVRIASVGAASDARPASNLNDGHEAFDCGRTAAEAATSDGPSSANCGLGSGLARVSLRSPPPLPPTPELSRLESDTASSSAVSEETSDSDRSSTSAAQDVESTGAKNGPPSLWNLSKKNSTSLDRFARAKAAGRELVKSNEEKELRSVIEEVIYYNPQIGDCVLGIVVSGAYGNLDIDIGANKLGYLFRKDVMPLDICNIREMSWEFPVYNSAESNDSRAPARGPRLVHDDEVLNSALEAPMAVALGTVLTMEVMGMTPSGRALLSARSVAREYAWQRVRQLYEYNATVEVQITEWTTAGLVTKIEGIRAFLPIYYLVRRAPEPPTPGSVSYKEYVGQKFTVKISSIDEKRSNLVISERKAWMANNAYVGALVEGIVTNIQPYGVHVRMKTTDISGVLHISNISRARVDNIASVFTIGEEVTVMVVPSNVKNRLSFSTADLETKHGLMLRDKVVVFQHAESIAAGIAKAYENKEESEFAIDNDQDADVVGQEIVIANRDWVDFGDKHKLDR